MSTDLHVERCLSSIRHVSDALADELLGVSADRWDLPTNCAPWRVRDLAAHVVSSGEVFVVRIRQGLAGSVEPGPGAEDRQSALAAATPGAVARALQAVTADFAGLYADLGDDELSMICFHRRGNRSVRWYAAHRLAEVAFHAWDLQLSLGRQAVLDEDVAALLLPMLLESNAPRTYAAGLTPQRGDGERYRLVVEDEPLARWVVTIGPDQLDALRGDAPADLTITGSAATLALLVYGRLELAALLRSNAVQVEGGPRLVERFPLIFPRP